MKFHNLGPMKYIYSILLHSIIPYCWLQGNTQWWRLTSTSRGRSATLWSRRTCPASWPSSSPRSPSGSTESRCRPGPSSVSLLSPGPHCWRGTDAQHSSWKCNVELIWVQSNEKLLVGSRHPIIFIQQDHKQLLVWTHEDVEAQDHSQVFGCDLYWISTSTSPSVLLLFCNELFHQGLVQEHNRTGEHLHLLTYN